MQANIDIITTFDILNYPTVGNYSSLLNVVKFKNLFLCSYAENFFNASLN